MTIKTPYKSEVIEEIKVDTSSIDGKIDVVDGLIDSLIARITEARAGYLDNINNANLATLPAISSTRIGYLDNLSGGAVALNSTVAKEATLTHATYGLDKIKTETASLVGKVDVIDGIVDSIVAKTNLIGASVAPADEYDTEMARITGNVALEATLTAIKGSGWSTQTLVALSSAINGLNDISASDVWSVATRSLTDKVDFALSTAGINAIRLSVCLTGDTANSIGKILYDFYNTRLSATRCGYIDYLANGTYGLSALNTDLDSVISYLSNGTYGLNALKTLVNDLETDIATVDSVVDTIQDDTDKMDSLEALIAAVMDLYRVGGTVTTDGTEQTVYISDNPSGLIKPMRFLIDTTNHTSDETVVLRFYYRIKNGGSYVVFSSASLSGEQSPLGVSYELLPNAWGYKVTIEKTAGTNRAYDWEIFGGE